MQQTDKYKLNLIERDDVFSPDALNENAEKLEEALEAVRAEAAAGDAALGQRVSALELHKCVIGYHVGSGFVDLGFTPAAVIASGYNGHALIMQGSAVSGITIVEGGLNHSGNFANCRYVALV